MSASTVPNGKDGNAVPVCERLLPDGRKVIGHWIVPPENEGYARFYFAHPRLDTLFPHTNPLRGQTICDVEVSCDACQQVLDPNKVRGLINDYKNCTEVRYVGECPDCGRILHNTLRFTGEGQMIFLKDNQWHITRPRSIWQRILSALWPF